MVEVEEALERDAVLGHAVGQLVLDEGLHLFEAAGRQRCVEAVFLKGVQLDVVQQAVVVHVTGSR